VIKKGCSESISLSVNILAAWESQVFPISHVFVCWFGVFFLFSQHSYWTCDSLSSVFEQSGVCYSTCISMCSLSALLRGCRSNLFAAAIDRNCSTKGIEDMGKSI